MTGDDNRSQRPRLGERQSARPARVGYGRPPPEHQFRPGVTGNPRGRPRGAKNESTILREILARKIAHRTRDRVRKITVLEGILLRITDDSLRGNIKSAAFLLNRYAALVSGELQVQDLSDEDREVLEAFARRLQPGRANDGENQ
jgi:hypothetical protein